MINYDGLYDIRLAKLDDVKLIMEFIEQYWKHDHILAHNRELFEYEFRENDRINMVLAIKKETCTIEAIWGFLKCKRGNDKSFDVWGSFWKVKDQENNLPFLGVEIAKRSRQLIGYQSHIGNGANPETTVKLRQMIFREKCAKMKQYYMLNYQLQKFNIAVIDKVCHKNYFDNSGKISVFKLETFKEFQEYVDVEQWVQKPQKDNKYIQHRFYQHPNYKYELFGIKDLLNSEETISAVVVLRTVKHREAYAVRIIDYLGDQKLFAYLGNEFQKMMQIKGYEYIDFYEYGFDEKAILDAGFIEREEHDKNIIPNYFEPYCAENVDIWVHYKNENTLFFKGDGDQDRPNDLV